MRQVPIWRILCPMTHQFMPGRRARSARVQLGVESLLRHFRDDAPGLLMILLGGLALMWLTSRWPDTPDGSLHLHRVRALAAVSYTHLTLPTN